MTRLFRVETLRSEDEFGRQEWTLAARRGPKMDNGPAEHLSSREAMDLVLVLICSGAEARILTESGDE